MPVKNMTKEQQRIGKLMYPETGYQRPRTRSECLELPRPCPFVACPYHLYLDVNPKTGSIKFNFPDIEPDQMKESCALDVAGRGEETLEEVADKMNMTRERVRQITDGLFAKIGKRMDMDEDRMHEKNS